MAPYNLHDNVMNAEMTKFLVIKSWGYGFWSDVSHVVGCLLLAEITQRIPITSWGNRSLYNDGSSNDAFRQYFNPVSIFRIEDLLDVPDVEFYPHEWNAATLAQDKDSRRSRSAGELISRSERVVVSDHYIGVPDIAHWIPESHAMHGKPNEEIFRDIFLKYIVPLPPIKHAVEVFHREHLREPFAAIHLRGSDKAGEQKNLDAVNYACANALAAMAPVQKIFLLTDDTRLVAAAAAVFGRRVVITDSRRTNSTTGVHYLGLPMQSRFNLGREILIDTYLAMKATKFVGNGASNVAAIIALTNEWPDGSCQLITPPAMMQRFA
jgi:protein O-GlcNAc transferase